MPLWPSQPEAVDCSSVVCKGSLQASTRRTHMGSYVQGRREVHVHVVWHIGERGRQNGLSSVKTVGTAQSAVQSRTTARTTTAHRSLPTSSTLLFAWLDNAEEIIDAVVCATTLQPPLQRLRPFLLAEGGSRTLPACR